MGKTPITRYEDGETQRTKNLRTVLEMQFVIEDWITSIIDHKGILEVYWKQRPPRRLNLMEIVEKAWDYLGETIVVHLLEDGDGDSWSKIKKNKK